MQPVAGSVRHWLSSSFVHCVVGSGRLWFTAHLVDFVVGSIVAAASVRDRASGDAPLVQFRAHHCCNCLRSASRVRLGLRVRDRLSLRLCKLVRFVVGSVRL